MPKIGEIKPAREIGYKSVGVKYIWSSCPSCGKERWVQFVKRDKDKLCFKCANTNRRKEGVISKDGKGYNRVLLHGNDFFISMANPRRQILEHRLIMARHIGRHLYSWEIVHHKNHIRDDNRIENLQLVTSDRHIQLSILEQRVKNLEGRVILLEAENTLLRNERNALLP